MCSAHTRASTRRDTGPGHQAGLEKIPDSMGMQREWGGGRGYSVPGVAEWLLLGEALTGTPAPSWVSQATAPLPSRAVPPSDPVTTLHPSWTPQPQADP